MSDAKKDEIGWDIILSIHFCVYVYMLILY